MSREWYFQVMGQEIGPLKAAELKSKVSTGQIQPDTLVRKGTEGKWVFAAEVQGLNAAPPEPPSTAPISGRYQSETAFESDSIFGTQPAISKPKGGIPTSIRIPDEQQSDSTSHEFYDFVGFRDAISPVLYDSVKQFAIDCGITLSQLNRRALADLIRRPELGGDLEITEVAALSQTADDNREQVGNDHPAGGNRNETTFFRFTLRNNGDRSVHLHHGVFLPTSITEQPSCERNAVRTRSHSHRGTISVRLAELAVGKGIRVAFDTSISPHETRDITIEFLVTEAKPAHIAGRLLLSHGAELTLSDIFSISLRG